MLSYLTQVLDKNGATDPIRTDDLLITSELLYQLSYSSKICNIGDYNVIPFESKEITALCSSIVYIEIYSNK